MKARHSSTCRSAAEECALENMLELWYGRSVGATREQYNRAHDYVREHRLVEQYLSDGTSSCYCGASA